MTTKSATICGIDGTADAAAAGACLRGLSMNLILPLAGLLLSRP